MGQEGSKDSEGLQDQISPQNGANNENQKFGVPMQRKDHVRMEEVRDLIGTNESIIPSKQPEGASAMVNPVPVDANEQKQLMTHTFDQELRQNEQTISDKFMAHDSRQIERKVNKQTPTPEGNTRTRLPSTGLGQNGDNMGSNRTQELRNPSSEKTDERLTKPPHDLSDSPSLGRIQSTNEKASSSPKSKIEKQLETHSQRLSALLKKTSPANNLAVDTSRDPSETFASADHLKPKTYECIEYKTECRTETVTSAATEVCIKKFQSS